MKITVTKTMFKDAFYQARRQDNFSYEGLSILFEYFEELEESCDISIELDVVAICCEYYEMRVADIAENYSIEIDDDLDNDEIVEVVEDYLNYHTSVCGKWTDDDGITYIVFSQF